MHPQLTDKKILCKEFMQALEACHLDGWARLTGGCNPQKDQLNKCLRQERIGRTTRNREQAKDRLARREEALKDLHEDD
ncbi:hypothetical protein PLICRDRAFT_162137 [Plicaturopsis crispa FD-325 SS-3]|nr:hypothetical protein PLICRDRAFT_162137 [Plicaturopsis crispa FD-325 SS-3]